MAEFPSQLSQDRRSPQLMHKTGNSNSQLITGTARQRVAADSLKHTPFEKASDTMVNFGEQRSADNFNP